MNAPKQEGAASIPASEAAERALSHKQIEAAAKMLAKCMDYPWEHMPEQGRNGMRKHAVAVIAAASLPAPSQERAGAVAWQPLSTAPEGVRVLLGPRDAPVVGLVRHMPDWADEQESVASVIHYNGTVLVAGYHCSEWCPLPLAAPSATIAAREQEAQYVIDHCEPMSPTEIYAEGRSDQWKDDQPQIELAAATRKSAARWDMLPAFLEKHQIDYVALVRDIDSELALREESPAASSTDAEGAQQGVKTDAAPAVDAGEQSGWLPIESAPKDGKDVLLFCPRRGVVRGRWDDCRFANRPRPYWTNDRESLWGVAATRLDAPTLWQPLPTPPASGGKA